MKEFRITILLTFFLVSAASAQVNWLTPEEVMTRLAKEPRPVFVDVYTDWCGWCKVMDKETFAHPQVAKLLNEKFYAIKFNAQQKAPVSFAGQQFTITESGYHQLAQALLNNQLSFPTVVFLNEELQIITPAPGYRKAPEFYKIALFLGSGDYKQTAWADWEKTYQPAF